MSQGRSLAWPGGSPGYREAMTVRDPVTAPGGGFTGEWLGQRVVFADGGVSELPGEVDRLGASRVLLVWSGRSGPGDQIPGLLGGRLAAQWNEVRQHVPARTASGITDLAGDCAADLIVAVGGGSATGLAKIAALRTGLPVLAVPTTYAGSEMTPVWGLTDGSVKQTGRDPRVLPRTVIYDPALLAALPPDLVGPSGMNALAHCVEALYAPLAEPLTSLTAVEGARLIASALPAAYLSCDAAARRELLWASCLAGRAFGTVGGSLHHSLCHLLGGFADLPHAQTHAIVLPHVVAFLAPSVRPAMLRLAGAMGGDPADVAGTIWDLGAAAGTPAGLSALGLPESSLPEVAAELLRRNPASPRPLDLDSALELVTAAWRGERPAARITGPAAAQPSPVTAELLTGSVISRLQATPDPRLRQVMTALVRHLHDLVTQVGLSRDEWLAVIGFLTATGQISNEQRQEFILLSDTLGVSMLVDLIAAPSAAGIGGHPTESTVLGPFYVAGSPERPYGGSIAERPSGDPAWVAGRVTGTDGQPIAGATLDIWQNDDDMLYAVQNPDAPAGHLRGVFSTRSDGSYAFLGVRPTDYPIPDDGPVGRLLAGTGRHPWRPAHIHLIVSAPGYRSVATHIFDSRSQYLTSDAVFAVKPSLIRQFERHEPGPPSPDGIAPGVPWYSLDCDFVLEPEPDQPPGE
jgi:maleylacetate reductase